MQHFIDERKLQPAPGKNMELPFGPVTTNPGLGVMKDPDVTFTESPAFLTVRLHSSMSSCTFAFEGIFHISPLGR